jgi:response regulator RpfG family c-di-GMP phosphodiesterase
MKQHGTIPPQTPIPLNVLLADDDIDDRHFFDKVLKTLPILTQLATVEDGEKLMTYLSENSGKLPDILFLDLNMPRKNGSECLSEIKHDEKLKRLPVIIYSTHKHEKHADLLYKKGAHYYIRKTDMIELAKVLHYILNLMVENKFARPAKDKFIFAMNTV